jgi:hypothetical protein
LIVLYLHGQGATLERDVQAARRAAPDRRFRPEHAAGGAAARSTTPPTSSAGNFWKPGHFAAYIDEARRRLMRLYGDQARWCAFSTPRRGHRAYSGGYLSTAYALANGGAAHRIKGVILMDSLYGDEDKFAAWAAGAAQARLPAERLH